MNIEQQKLESVMNIEQQNWFSTPMESETELPLGELRTLVKENNKSRPRELQIVM